MLKDRSELLGCLPHHHHSLAQVDAFGHIKRSVECLDEFGPPMCIWIHLGYCNANVICSRSDGVFREAGLYKH